MLVKTLGKVSARSAVARTSRGGKGSRFLRRIPTTSLAVQAHKAIKTSSIGLFAAWPTKRSSLAHNAVASIMGCASLVVRFVLRLAGAAVRVVLVDGILPLWPLQPDDHFLLGLVNGVILSEGLETRGDDLHAQHSVRNTIAPGLALAVGLKFKSAFRLLAAPSHGMQDDGGIAHRLAVVVFEDSKLKRRHLPGILLLVPRHQQSRN